MNKDTNTILLDGDILAYKVSASCEEAVNWGNDLWTLHADAYEGKAQVDLYIQQLKEDLNAKEIQVFLTGKHNFRYDLYPDYKGNRKSTRKPMILGALKDHLKDKWDAHLIEGVEADDLLGIAATEPEFGDKSIIVSVDKDFKGVPCKFYNPDHPEEGVETFSLEDADRHHLFQTLVGDTADNYKGCPSYGPVKANKLLDKADTFQNAWDMIVEAFDKAGLSSKHALVQARLARILRYNDYDFESGKVKLWQPQY